jgi:hypothetical protein
VTLTEEAVLAATVVVRELQDAKRTILRQVLHIAHLVKVNDEIPKLRAALREALSGWENASPSHESAARIAELRKLDRSPT